MNACLLFIDDELRQVLFYGENEVSKLYLRYQLSLQGLMKACSLFIDELL